MCIGVLSQLGVPVLPPPPSLFYGLVLLCVCICQAAGSCFLGYFAVLSVLVSVACRVAPDYWLSYWVKDAHAKEIKLPPGKHVDQVC